MNRAGEKGGGIREEERRVLGRGVVATGAQHLLPASHFPLLASTSPESSGVARVVTGVKTDSRSLDAQVKFYMKLPKAKRFT